MKNTIRFFATLMVGLFIQLPGWAQRSIDFQESSAGSLFNREAIAAFFASSEFKIIIASIVGLTVLTWVVYLFGTFQMSLEDRTKKGEKLNFPLPSEFIPRGSIGTHFFGPSAPILIPANEEKNQEEEEREHNHYPNRG